MQITIDTSAPLSDTDKAILALVAGTADTTIVQEPAKVPTPAPKKTPAPKPEPEPEPEVDEDGDDEDLIGGAPTVQDAIDKATALIGQGKQALVKAALKAIGADRVSNIPASKAARFLEEVEG